VTDRRPARKDPSRPAETQQDAPPPRPPPSGGSTEMSAPLSSPPTEAAVDGSESQTKVSRLAIVRGGLWGAAAQLLPAAGVAVLSVVTARVLGTNALGRQSLIAFVNAAAAATFVTGLSGAALQVMGRLQGTGDSRLDELGAWMVRAHVVTGVVLCAGLAGIGLVLHQDRLAWLIIGLVTVVDAAVSGLGARVAVRQGWVEVGRLNLVAQLFGAPLGIAALAVGFGIPGIFAGDGVAAVGLLVAMIIRFAFTFPKRRYPWRLRPPVPIARPWCLFVLSNFLSQVVGRRVEFLALAVFSTNQQIAYYSVAFTLVSLLASVPTAVAGAALPVIAAAEGRGEMAVATGHMRSAVRVGSLLSVPLVGFAVALGPVLVELVYGSRYHEAAALVPLSSLVLLVAVVGGVLGQYWAGRGDVGVTLVIGSIAGVLDLGLAFALVPSLGARGAVVANLVGQLVLAGGLLYVTVRRTGSMGTLGTAGVRMLVASAVGAVIAWRVSVLVIDHVGGARIVVDLLAVVAGGAAGVPITIVLAILIKVMRPADADWLRPLLPRRLAPLLRSVTSRPAAST